MKNYFYDVVTFVAGDAEYTYKQVSEEDLFDDSLFKDLKQKSSLEYDSECDLYVDGMFVVTDELRNLLGALYSIALYNQDLESLMCLYDLYLEYTPKILGEAYADLKFVEFIDGVEWGDIQMLSNEYLVPVPDGNFSFFIK